MKGGIGWRRKIFDGYCVPNLNSICCVYKEIFVLKRLKPKNVASIQIQKVAIFDLDRKKVKLIPKKIIQILQPIIDFFQRIPK